MEGSAEYLFVLSCEVRSVHLIDGHDDGHHIFAIHEGRGEHRLGLVLRQDVHKVTVVFVLPRQDRRG